MRSRCTSPRTVRWAARAYDDGRVLDAIGAEVMAFVHYWWEALVQTGAEPPERRFVTPELIKASSPLVGPPDEIIDHLRTYEAAGVGEVVILCPTAPSREVYTDIREQVIDRY